MSYTKVRITELKQRANDESYAHTISEYNIKSSDYLTLKSWLKVYQDNAGLLLLLEKINVPVSSISDVLKDFKE